MIVLEYTRDPPPYPVCAAVAIRSLVHPDWIFEIQRAGQIDRRAATLPPRRGGLLRLS